MIVTSELGNESDEVKSIVVGSIYKPCFVFYLASQLYVFNVTSMEKYFNVYFDGVEYLFGDSVGNKLNWNLQDTILADFMPSVIAVYAYSSSNLGVLASDSAGLVTNTSWKCTRNVYADWMLTSFDDSAWPTPLVKKINGQRDISW